jgi:hypothetical protein
VSRPAGPLGRGAGIDVLPTLLGEQAKADFPLCHLLGLGSDARSLLWGVREHALFHDASPFLMVMPSSVGEAEGGIR